MGQLTNYDVWINISCLNCGFTFLFYARRIDLPYPMITVSVLSRATLVITITAGVVQAKILYITNAFLL